MLRRPKSSPSLIPILENSIKTCQWVIVSHSSRGEPTELLVDQKWRWFVWSEWRYHEYGTIAPDHHTFFRRGETTSSFWGFMPMFFVSWAHDYAIPIGGFSFEANRPSQRPYHSSSSWGPEWVEPCLHFTKVILIYVTKWGTLWWNKDISHSYAWGWICVRLYKELSWYYSLAGLLIHHSLLSCLFVYTCLFLH